MLSAWRERLLESAAGRYWYRLWEWRRSIDPTTWWRDARGRDCTGPDGLPLPPARLVVGVGAVPSLDWYVSSGEQDAARLRACLERAGVGCDRRARILDFGCGCGRLTRHLMAWTREEVVGSDHSRPAIRWCRRNLLAARFLRNDLAPPVALESDSIDLAIAFSVFTHLDEVLAESWLRELRRVLSPGGRLVLTSHGDAYRDHLPDAERAAFDTGEIVVRRRRATGSNLCAAFHPAEALHALLASHFDVMLYESGSACAGRWQDVWVLGHPATVATRVAQSS